MAEQRQGPGRVATCCNTHQNFLRPYAFCTVLDLYFRRLDIGFFLLSMQARHVHFHSFYTRYKHAQQRTTILTSELISTTILLHNKTSPVRGRNTLNTPLRSLRQNDIHSLYQH